jgi:hypothetical protein
MIKRLGYGLHADKKPLTVTMPHKDRDAPFGHITGECKKAVANGTPVLAIDVKKKENLGNLVIF